MPRLRPRSTSARRSSPIRAGWLLLLAAVLVVCCRDSDEQQPAAEVGKSAPNVKLETLDHDRFYLNDQRGKPVVLVFWNTSCQICKREMVELESLRKAIGPHRVAMASVCSDPENIDVARRMVSGLGLGFPTLLDRGGKITAAFRVKDFPTTVVVTPEGKIGFVREGYTEPLMRQLRRAIESQLEATQDAD